MNKEEIIEYLKKNEVTAFNARAAALLCDIVFGAYTNAGKVAKVNFSPQFCYVSYKRFNSFFQITPKKMTEEAEYKVYEDYLKNPKTLAEKMERHKEIEEELDDLWRKYSEKRIDISDRKIFEFYEKLLKLSQKWWHYAAIGEGKGAIITSKIVPAFAKRQKISIKEAEEIINTLSHPEKPAIFNLERKIFLKICSDILNKKDASSRINQYLENYFWFKTDFYQAKEITFEMVLKAANEEIKKNKEEKIKKEFKAIEDQFLKIGKQKKKLLLSLKLDKKDKKDIYFCQQIISWIDERKIGMMKNIYYWCIFISDLAKKKNISYPDLMLYLNSELKEFIRSGKRINKNENIQRRNGAFFAWEKNGGVNIFYGKEGKELFKLATDVKGEEIKGQVASTGGIDKIIGKARIIYNPSKDQFNKEDILVTSMTRVEFVPLMRKAKAIVTNEGGIACHAAIVSRELNIPCIIGTKNATKILKDGQMIELDLKTGIVKIV